MFIRKCQLCGAEFDNEFDENNHIMMAHVKRTSDYFIFNNDITNGTGIHNVHKTIDILSSTNLSSIMNNERVKKKFAQSFSQSNCVTTVNKINHNQCDKLIYPGNCFTQANKAQRYMFPCHMCSKKFSNVASLNKHKQGHEVNTVNCPLCSKTFVNKHFLAPHVEDAHCSENNLICELCEEEVENTSKLQKHILRHATSGKRSYDNWHKSCLQDDMAASEANFFNEQSTSRRACLNNLNPNSSSGRLELNRNGFEDRTSRSERNFKPKQRGRKSNERKRKGVELEEPCDIREQLPSGENSGEISSRQNRNKKPTKKKAKNDTEPDFLETRGKRNSYYRDKVEIEKALAVKCPICPKHFLEESYLQSHILNKHLTVVKCTICHKVEPSAKHLSAHMLQHTSKIKSTAVQNSSESQINTSVVTDSAFPPSCLDRSYSQNIPSQIPPRSEISTEDLSEFGNLQIGLKREMQNDVISYPDVNLDDDLVVEEVINTANKCSLCSKYFQSQEELRHHTQFHII